MLLFLDNYDLFGKIKGIENIGKKMNVSIIESIKKRVLGNDITKLEIDPSDTRALFVNDLEALRATHLKEYMAWYSSDGDEILNFYTGAVVQDFPNNPIFFRNCRNYFWAKNVSKKEANFKKVHSGLPKNIITTLVNNIGEFKISSNKENSYIKDILEDILTFNDFKKTVNQKELPLTLVCGDGAFKIIIDNNFASPIVEYYDGRNVKPIFKYNQLIGLIFEDIYKIGVDNYYLYDIRFIKNGNSYVHYELYSQSDEQVKKNECTRVPVELLNKLGENINIEDICIFNYNKILGEYCRFFTDETNSGKSLFSGVCDRFDDLDQTLSIGGRAIKTSSPIEYYKREAIGRDGNGNPIMPSEYDRNYVELNVPNNGDGTSNGASVFSTQPVMNVSMYQEYMTFLTNLILIGMLSPATMGIDVSRKDNAQAQREKEKITIFMRENVIATQKRILKSLFVKVLEMAGYMKSGKINTSIDFGSKFSVYYDDFYAPTFETKLAYLGSAFANNEISTRLYVDMLYDGKLTEEQKNEEIAYLNNLKQTEPNYYNDFNSIAREELNNEETNTPTKDIRAIL